MKKLITPFAVLAVTTLVFGTIYAAVQQSQRMGANDPQIQLAQDTSAQLNTGSSPETLVTGKVNLKESLAAAVIIYNKAGKPVAGTGYLDSKLPVVPYGVLLSSRGHAYNAVTWQPQAGVRLASVTVAAQDYFVLSARSLSDVEKNENTTFQLAAMGWLASILVFMCAYWVLPRLMAAGPKKKS